MGNVTICSWYRDMGNVTDYMQLVQGHGQCNRPYAAGTGTWAHQIVVGHAVLGTEFGIVLQHDVHSVGGRLPKHEALDLYM